MRVYDIISLKEDLDIRPTTTLGPDGKPAGFEVFDTDKPKQTLQRFSGPDAEGKAEEWRDKERARLGGKKPEPNKPVKDTEPNPKNKTLGQRIAGGAVKSGFRNLLRVGRAIGFSQLPGYVEDYQLIQADLYARYVQAIENGKDPKVAKQEFDALSKAAFGQWVAGSGIITLGAELIVRTAAAGGGAVVKAVRSWNASTSVAAGATGVGLLPAIVKFVLVEGAIWAVSYALASETVAKTVFKYLVGSSYDMSIQALYAAADLGQAVGSGISNLVGDDETRAAWRDVQNAMGMDPMRTGSEQEIGKQVDMKTAPRQGTTNTAPRQAAPSGSLSSQVPN